MIVVLRTLFYEIQSNEFTFLAASVYAFRFGTNYICEMYFWILLNFTELPQEKLFDNFVKQDIHADEGNGECVRIIAGEAITLIILE